MHKHDPDALIVSAPQAHSYLVNKRAFADPALFARELQEIYEIILGRLLDRRNFRKKILAAGLLKPLRRQRRGRHRPAQLYAFARREPMNVQLL